MTKPNSQSAYDKMPRTNSAHSARHSQEAQRDRRARNAVAAIADPLNGFGLEFENAMRSLDFSVCSQCRKRFTRDARYTQCSTCRRSRNNLFSSDNHMDIGEIPNVLRNLSLIEQILIARVHPVVSVFKIRGAQTGYSGHVMNFVQHVEQIATRLPHNPRNLDAIVILNRETPNGVAQFRFRSGRVREALLWLKRNNRYYSDIVIDDNLLVQLPEDGNVSNLLPTHHVIERPDDVDPFSANANDGEEADNIVHSSCYPNLPNLDADAIIRRNVQLVPMVESQSAQSNQDIGDWPDLTRNPSLVSRSKWLKLHIVRFSSSS